MRRSKLPTSLPGASALPWLGVAGLSVAFAGAAAAATAGGSDLDWWTMGMTLLGGLSLFLFGMEQMAEALKSVAGDSMKRILARLTDSRIMGLITGAVVTAVIQSSSVTTVMLVGFVSANLMSLAQAVGVILGADIGTTITAQIVAFKVTKYALLLVTIGFVMIFVGRTQRTKDYGSLVMGLGLIFFGMGVMSDAMKPLRSFEPFIAMMQNVSNPVVGILVATLFTSLVQSSSATMGVIIALALQGLVSLEGGIALALGANIGTCVTAALASIGKPREAIRVAVAHVTFKIAGVLLIVWFIPPFADLVRAVSPTAAEGVTGMERLAAETPRQIANAHTLFNVGIAFLFLPMSTLFARFCEWVVPDAPLPEKVDVIAARYLDDNLLQTPALALDRTQLEISRMGSLVEDMLGQSVPALLAGDQPRMREIARIDDKVDMLHHRIIEYLGKVNEHQLSDAQSAQATRLMEVVNNLESIGDIVETDTLKLAEEQVEREVVISDETKAILTALHATVTECVGASVRSIADQDAEIAIDVIQRKRDINKQVDAAVSHLMERLSVDLPNRLATYSLEMELVEKLRRVYYFAKRIAKVAVPEELAEHRAA